MTDNAADEAGDDFVSQDVAHQGDEVDDVTVRDLPPGDDDTLNRLDEPT